MVNTNQVGANASTPAESRPSFTCDQAVREFANIVLTIRSDLRFQPQAFEGKMFVVVEDPLNAKFYRIGVAEFAFLSLLDGRTTVAAALSHLVNSASGEVLTENEAAGFCKWLLDSEIASNAALLSTRNRPTAVGNVRSANRWGNWNPIAMRWPLLYPDPFFSAITPFLRWMFGRGALVAWVATILLAFQQILTQWSRIVVASSTVVVLGNAWWLTACWIVLKCLHEMAHGVVCKKYGGSIRGAGMMLVLLAPIAYVDVTGSWRCRSKWERMHIALAGVYFELWIAAAAILTWSHTGSGVLQHVCLNVAVMASLTTLVFNANPLMRFDGYYVLTDWLEIPNLYARGQQWLMSATRRLLFGNTTSQPRQSTAFVIPLYAILSLAWRIVVCTAFFIAATTMFHGAGIAIAFLAILTWVAVPIGRFVTSLNYARQWRRLLWRRLCILSGILAGAVVLLFVAIPWPGACVAPAVVDHTQPQVVRAESAGFVREVCVAAGDFVEQGQVLAVLENKQLQFELDDLRLNLEQSSLLCRMNETRHKLAESQAERDRIAEWNQRISEKEAQIAQLTIRAARQGNVVGRDLETLLGKFLHQGDQILIIGEEGKKQLQLSVSQDDLEAFAARIGHGIKVQVAGMTPWSATLTMLEPQAELHPKLLSLCAVHGGPIPVRERKADAGTNADESKCYEFLAPRFGGSVELSDSQSRQLHSGQLATVWFRPHNETVGMHLFHLLSRRLSAPF